MSKGGELRKQPERYAKYGPKIFCKIMLNDFTVG
jgi:hypothetical protein